MKQSVFTIFIFSCFISSSQITTTGEEPGFGQYFCYLGQAVRPVIPGNITCNCKWEWVPYHSSVFPCYPFNGLQLVYEEHFGKTNWVREPFTTAPFQSFNEQLVYRDWRRGYGFNGANAPTATSTSTNTTSWDADTTNVNIQNGGGLVLSAIKRPAPKSYPMFDGSGVFTTPYTGGTIITQDKWGYGAFEIRCKMATDPEGLNHSFWLTGGTTTGCTKEEIDVFETFDDIRNDTPPQSLLYDLNPTIEQKNRRILTSIWSSPCDNDGARCNRHMHTKLASGDYLSNWHTFKLFWTPYETTLYMDGVFIYKMYSFGLGLFQTNPIQQGTNCAIMSITANAVDAIASLFPYWWPQALIPKYYVKRMKTYPRAENSTMHLLVQNAIRVADGQHLNLPQQMEVDYVKVWQFGNCQTDVVKTGLYSNGCNHDAPYVNYHMGQNITYKTDFVLSNTDQCNPAANNNDLNYQNKRLIACASNDIIFEPGSTFEYGTHFETRIQPCMPIDKLSGTAPTPGLFRGASPSAPTGYPRLRDTIINGQYALYEPQTIIGAAGDGLIVGNEIAVEPNPASDYIVLQTSFDTGTYEMIGTYGETVKTGDIHSRQERINIADLKDGVYYIRFNKGDTNKQTRFIKLSL